MRILVFADVHYFGDDLETAIFSRTKKLVENGIPDGVYFEVKAADGDVDVTLKSIQIPKC